MFEDVYKLIDKFKNTDVESMIVQKGKFRLQLKQDETNQLLNSTDQENLILHDVQIEECVENNSPNNANMHLDQNFNSNTLEQPNSVSSKEMNSDTEHSNEDSNIVKVGAPVVGFFHVRTPSAQKAQGEGENVYVGLEVKEGDTLCYIRANEHYFEVTSPVNGTVVRSNCHEDDFIEYDQVLYEIRRRGADNV